MGLSTTACPKRHQRGLPYREPQCNRVLLSGAIWPWLEHESDFHSALGHIECPIQAQRELVHHTSKHKRRAACWKFTPLELLKQIKDFLPSQMPKIQIDYIGLTGDCYGILHSFRLEVKRTLGIDHPLRHCDETIQINNPEMVLKILKEARDVQNVSQSRQELLCQSPQMEVVARILKGYLDVRERATSR